MDFVYLGIVAVAFVATFGLLKVCEWLIHEKYGERS